MNIVQAGVRTTCSHIQGTQGGPEDRFLLRKWTGSALGRILSQGWAGLEIGAIIAGFAFGFSSQTALATPTETPLSIGERETCSDSLNALVSYFDETAQIEGTSLRVERRGNGAVVLHYNDLVQHMKCRDGELHIDIQDPP